jgi:hypothetical protein
MFLASKTAIILDKFKYPETILYDKALRVERFT